MARTCHLIFLCLDVLKPLGHKAIIEHELEGFGIRLNKKPPQITFRVKEKGGLNYNPAVEQSELDKELVQVNLPRNCNKQDRACLIIASVDFERIQNPQRGRDTE